MKKLYLITGATGHVGTNLVSVLRGRKEYVGHDTSELYHEPQVHREQIRALVYPGDGETLPSDVGICYGDITDSASLRPFFDRSGCDEVTLIHCAAFITIASKEDPRVWNTNVNGTANIMELALSSGVDRVVCVSSVHAIPERPKPEVITEVDSFSPDLVHGQYAKSKAAAAQIVLDYARKGLNVSIVHPSGIIGPGDTKAANHMIRTIRAAADGLIPVGIRGGYDFVDARDVADGILACEEHGRSGECYILSGSYITVLDLVNMVRGMVGRRPTGIELPHGIARSMAPIGEGISGIFGKRPPLFTPYSVYTLQTNGFFSYEKARREFGYQPRDIEQSVRDSL